MKLCRISAILLVLALVCSVNANAASVLSSQIVGVDDFESYGSISDSSWAINGDASCFTLADTERGQSLKITPPAGVVEYKKSVSMSSGSTALLLGASLKFEGTPWLIFYVGSSNYLIKVEDGHLYTRQGILTDSKIIESGKWYDFMIEFDTSDGSTVCTVTDGVSTHTVTAVQNFTSVDRVCLGVKNFDNTVVYADDIWISSLKSPSKGVTSFLPEFGYVAPSTRKITVNLQSEPLAESIDGVKVSLNGDETAAQKLEYVGSTLEITLAEPIGYDAAAMLEFTGVTLSDGTGCSGVCRYYTKPLCTVTDIGFSQAELAPGEITASAKVSCESGVVSEAIALVVLYDSETGAYTAQNFNKFAVSAVPVEVSARVTVPDDGKKYKAVLYIWDNMFNMLPLCRSLELSAQ